MTTTATDSSGSNLALTITPTLQGGTLDWAMSGTGCSSTTAGRGINCDKN